MSNTKNLTSSSADIKHNSGHDGIELTPVESLLFFNIVRFNTDHTAVDWDQVALHSNLKNAGSAKVRFRQIQKKYNMNSANPIGTTASNSSSTRAISTVHSANSRKRKAPVASIYDDTVGETLRGQSIQRPAINHKPAGGIIASLNKKNRNSAIQDNHQLATRRLAGFQSQYENMSPESSISPPISATNIKEDFTKNTHQLTTTRRLSRGSQHLKSEYLPREWLAMQKLQELPQVHTVDSTVEVEHQKYLGDLYAMPNDTHLAPQKPNNATHFKDEK